MGDRAALDYTPVLMLMDRMKLSDADWRELWQEVRTMEAAALKERR